MKLDAKSYDPCRRESFFFSRIKSSNKKCKYLKEEEDAWPTYYSIDLSGELEIDALFFVSFGLCCNNFWA